MSLENTTGSNKPRVGRREFALLLSMAMVMLLTAYTAQKLKPQGYSADAKPAVVLRSIIPEVFGDWTVDHSIAPISVTPDVKATLDKIYNETFERTYNDSRGHQIMLSVAYGRDQASDETQVHRPEFCYAAQGFSVKNLGNFNISLDDRNIHATRLFSSRGSRLEPIIYWIVIDQTTVVPGFGRKLSQITSGLAGKIPDGLIFRVSSIGESGNDSYQEQLKFIEDLFNAVAPESKADLFGK